MVQIADLTVWEKAISGLFGINGCGVPSEFRDHYICCDPDTGEIGRKKNVFSGKGYKMNFERVKRRSRYSSEAVPFIAGTPIVCGQRSIFRKEVEFDLSRDACSVCGTIREISQV